MGSGLGAGAVEVVRAYCDAWMDGDIMKVLALYHEELTLEWPGRHRFAGNHEGQQASIEALLDLQAVTNRMPVRIVDVLEGAGSVAVVVDERWTRDGEDGADQVLEHRRVLDYTVDDGKLRSCRIYESAQRDVDDWIGESDASSTTDAPPTADHGELLARCSTGWATRDVEAIVACHTIDSTFENHGLTERVTGREAVADAFRALLAEHPDLSTTPLRTTFGADHAVVEYEVHTVVEGVPMGAPAVDLFRFRDGLIASKDTWVSGLRSV